MRYGAARHPALHGACRRTINNASVVLSDTCDRIAGKLEYGRRLSDPVRRPPHLCNCYLLSRSAQQQREGRQIAARVTISYWQHSAAKVPGRCGFRCWNTQRSEAAVLRAYYPDILVPQLRMRLDKARHEARARRVLKHFDQDAPGAEQLLLANESLVLADDDPRNAVEKNRAAAHRTRRQRRVHHRLAIDSRGLPPGVLERIHFAVQDRAALLHAAIVSSPDDAAAMDEHRADRNPALAAGPARPPRSPPA